MEPTRLDTLRQDVRFGVRQLARNPVFTAVAVLTLALGIGANTAIFSVVDGILFRPLPFPEPDELVNVWTDVTERGGPEDEWLSYINFHDLREQAETLEGLAAWGGWRPTLTGEGEAEQLSGAQVTHDMFDRVLGVAPALGRDFVAADDEPNAPGVVLLSHGFWRRAFGGDPSVVGRTLRMNDMSWEVIGVMPDRFRPPFLSDAELWTTARQDLEVQADRRGGFSWRAVGRLADGATLGAADAELRAIGSRFQRLYPESNTGMTFDAVALRDDLVSEARTGLLVLLGGVAFVLLMACVNVANLLLARAGSRREELAVRSALGAGRGRLATQLLTEAGILAAVGGVAGVLLAIWGTDALVALAPPGTPRIDEVGVDGRVLAVTAAVTLVAGGLFGLVPALRAARQDAVAAIREGGRGRAGGRGAARLRAALVVGQVALALVLLVGAGLLVRSFRNLRTFDLGFRPAGVVTLQVNLPGASYETGDALRAFYASFLDRLESIPGVNSAAFTSTVPLTGFDGDVSFTLEGEPIPGPGVDQAAWIRRVTPGYFETMGIPLVAGRDFAASDGPDDARVVIINQTFAARYFPNQNPVGRRINVNNPSDPVWREIVGVAGDVRNFGIREDSRVAFYGPYDQIPAGYVFPVLRASVPPEDVVPAVRAELAQLDASLAVGRVATLDDLVLDAIASDRFVATLLTLFAVIALVLAVVGLYGVVAYSVGRRLPEMGVRMALGAAGSDIARMVVAQSLVLVAGGIVVGVAAAAGLTRLLEGLLFGVAPLDLATFGAVVAALALAGTAAAAIPALRAGRVDPVRVLSSE
jgi:putative ABC transport system permease protein